jgi:hypothetical protein
VALDARANRNWLSFLVIVISEENVAATECSVHKPINALGIAQVNGFGESTT